MVYVKITRFLLLKAMSMCVCMCLHVLLARV